MSKSVDTNQIYSLVRKRLGPDATNEMIESVGNRVAALLSANNDVLQVQTEPVTTGGTRMILTATGLDSPNAAEDIMAQLQSYKCLVLGADRATADGFFSLLVSFDMVSCTLNEEELGAALEITASADSLEICLKQAPTQA